MHLCDSLQSKLIVWDAKKEAASSTEIGGCVGTWAKTICENYPWPGLVKLVVQLGMVQNNFPKNRPSFSVFSFLEPQPKGSTLFILLDQNTLLVGPPVSVNGKYVQGHPISRNQPNQSSKQEGILGVHIRSPPTLSPELLIALVKPQGGFLLTAWPLFLVGKGLGRRQIFLSRIILRSTLLHFCCGFCPKIWCTRLKKPTVSSAFFHLKIVILGHIYPYCHTRTHTCSEIAYRIIDVECIARAKTPQ